MKKILVLLLFMTFVSCSSNDSPADWKCGFHNGKQLYTGERGGCYCLNSKGNKTYVDRSECNC
jgi:hypothetical protein